MIDHDLRNELEKFESMVVKMVDDTRLYQDYLSDPKGTMTKEGIRPDVIEVMVHGSLADIRDLYNRANIPVKPIIVKIYEP